MGSFCAHLLSELRTQPGLVGVTFVGPRVIADLNLRYRGRGYPTDVLSFLYPGETVDGKPYLGEIVLAPAVAAENARRAGTSFEAEVRRLLVHGVLHLAGYDHETDGGEMLRLQSRLLRRRGIAGAPLVRSRRTPGAGPRPGLRRAG